MLLEHCDVIVANKHEQRKLLFRLK